MQYSPNTMKAVGLLNKILSDAQAQSPTPLPPPPPFDDNLTSSNPPSALDLLNDIIGEMEAVTCHENSSMENLGRHVKGNPVRLTIRRGASREIAATVTGDLKRPENDSSPLMTGKRDPIRRTASTDLSATVTGNLKRAEEDDTDTDHQQYEPAPERRGLRRGASREIASTVMGGLKRPEDDSSPPAGKRDPVRRTASTDLSATVTGGLKRPANSTDDGDEVEWDSTHELTCSPTSENPRGKLCFGKSESICEVTEEGLERESESSTTTLTSAAKHYSADDITVNWIDLRVGKILSVTKHDSADKLYCETIDVGEAEPRSIASGLVPYYSLAELQDRLVVVVCNLKARNLVGFPSNGMVLCASSGGDGDRQVELLCPPPGAMPGDRIFAAGVPGEIVTPQKCDKKKIFPKVAMALAVDEHGRFMWDSMVLRVGDLPQGEACSAPSLRNTEVG